MHLQTDLMNLVIFCVFLLFTFYYLYNGKQQVQKRLKSKKQENISTIKKQDEIEDKNNYEKKTIQVIQTKKQIIHHKQKKQQKKYLEDSPINRVVLQSIQQQNSMLQSQNLQQQNTQKRLKNKKSFKIELKQISSNTDEKWKQRLYKTKTHYKQIIEDLQHKLQTVGIPLSSQELKNQTIIFSEGDSLIECLSQQNMTLPLQINAFQVEQLRKQLQRHEQALTNLIIEDLQIKQQLHNLQNQNIMLKSKLNLVEQTKDNKKQQQLRQKQRLFKQKIQCSFHTVQQQMQQRDCYSQRTSKLDKNLFSPKLGNSWLYSSMIIGQRASLGLLQQCRCINEISKRFILSAVRKIQNKKINDTQLLYRYQKQIDDKQLFIKHLVDFKQLLFIIKLNNQLSMAIYIPQIINFSQQQNSVYMDHNKLSIILDLKNRKYDKQMIDWSLLQNKLQWKQKIIIHDTLPPTMFLNDKPGKMQNSNQIYSLWIYRLISQQ